MGDNNVLGGNDSTPSYEAPKVSFGAKEAFMVAALTAISPAYAERQPSFNLDEARNMCQAEASQKLGRLIATIEQKQKAGENTSWLETTLKTQSDRMITACVEWAQAKAESAQAEMRIVQAKAESAQAKAESAQAKAESEFAKEARRYFLTMKDQTKILRGVKNQLLSIVDDFQNGRKKLEQVNAEIAQLWQAVSYAKALNNKYDTYKSFIEPSELAAAERDHQEIGKMLSDLEKSMKLSMAEESIA